MPLARSGTVSARLWQNRHAARQNLERTQREARSRLEADRSRAFGGPGWVIDQYGDGDGDRTIDEDSEDLEEKMLEYFGGMKWLDT